MTIQEAIKEAHDCAKEKGFYNPPPTVPAILALINTELSEAIQADRNEIKSNAALPYDNIIGESAFKTLYEIHVKDTLEDELAGACIRIFDLAGYLGIELWNPPTNLNELDIPGNIMEAMSSIGIAYIDYNNLATIRLCLSNAMGTIFAISKKLDFDLWAHIEAAMRYNRLREFKHGKKY